MNGFDDIKIRVADWFDVDTTSPPLISLPNAAITMLPAMPTVLIAQALVDLDPRSAREVPGNRDVCAQCGNPPQLSIKTNKGTEFDGRNAHMGILQDKYLILKTSALQIFLSAVGTVGLPLQ